MTEAAYARLLRVASLIENETIYRIDERSAAGGPPNKVPKEFCQALLALLKKRMLTASDMARIINVGQPRAKFLLDYLERKGLARSEYHDDARVRIYFYGSADEQCGVHAVP